MDNPIVQTSYLNQIKAELKTRCFWRDCLVEVVATFILMSVQCALPLSWGDKGTVPTVFGNIVQVGLGMGFVVSATAWTFGDFGGCHMNPAVSVAMTARGNILITRGLIYIASQCIGALGGAGFVYSITPENRRETLSATELNPELNVWQGLLVEVWLTFILVSTIHGATNSKRKGNLYMPTVIIGCAVTVGVMSGSAQTGASMNPARSLGPAVLMSIWKHHWIYWVGPILGGLVATLLYYLIDLVPDSGSKEESFSAVQQLAVGSNSETKF